MIVSPPASQTKTTEALIAIGGELIGQTRQSLLQQILVACSITTAPIPPTPPSTPTGFTATAGNQLITLTWDSQPEADTFEIVYSTSNTFATAVSLAAGITGTSFTHDSGESIQVGEKYYYWLRAINGSGVSDWTDGSASSVTARSFVTLANSANRNLTVPSSGSWTLETILFGSTPVPDLINILEDGVEYVSISGGWLDVNTESPAVGVPVVGTFNVANFSGSSFTFWNQEP